MEVVKKNLISIICGVIALVAVVAYFWPVSGWYEEFKGELNKRVKVGQDVAVLLNTPRELPPDLEGKSQALKRFPSKAVIDSGNNAMAGVHKQSTDALAYVVDLNRQGHDLLVPGSLPRATERTTFPFRSLYLWVMTPGAAKPAAAAGPSTAENLADGLLRAIAPPTDAEIAAAMAKKWQDEYEPTVIKIEKPGQPLVEPNRRDVALKFLTDTKNFAEVFRHKRSTEYKIYMEPDALSLGQHMEPTVTPTTEDIWYAQMNLWVQQDICRAIRDMNIAKDKSGKEIPGIAGSRVKHLVSIDVPAGFDMYVTQLSGPAATALAPSATPAAVSADTSDPKVYTRSVTGRVCNVMYDVVHSRLTVVCNEDCVDALIKMLEKGRMITVLQTDLVKVDNAAAKDLGYDYGDVPVVRVTLQLEHLFLRAWTALAPGAPMPPEVQGKLGIQPATDQPAAPARGPVAAR